MVLTAKDLWLYQNQEYLEGHERLLRESNALCDLLEEMDWTPSTPEERESIKSQSTKVRTARMAVRELGEQLMAAHSVQDKK